jgi:pimeloyl-ACP methyl ester carboxylesterase
MTAPLADNVRWSVPSHEKYLSTADGQSIYASARGTGRIAVVVVHGFTGGHRHGSFSRLLGWFEQHFLVIAVDQRGHGKSSGSCTLSHFEVFDVDAAVEWARELGASKVITVGFSMGASSVIRHAALSRTDERSLYDEGIVLRHAPDAMVSIGGVSRWWFRGTTMMKILHLSVNTALGRAYLKYRQGVTINDDTWPDENHPSRLEIQPWDPQQCAARLGSLPVLFIQGELDKYFPPEHGKTLAEIATSAPEHSTTFWFEHGMGHAEAATTQKLVNRIGEWIHSAVGAQS